MRKIVDQLRSSKTTNRLIYICLALIFILVVVSFFWEPKYEKGVWTGLMTLSSALTGVLGFKFGITIPGGQVEGGPSSREDVPLPVVTCPKCGTKCDAEIG